MTDRLEERLKELGAFVEHQHALESVEETVGHLQHEVQDAMGRSRARAQQCTILLFQSSEPPSLLRFLAASADFSESERKREMSHARISVLALLADFLEVYGDHRALTKDHVVALYQTCQGIARADPFSKVKAQALVVVTNVLRFASKRVSNADVQPREYVDKLFYDIKFSKATQTAKGQMLEVIGYLAQKFLDDVGESAPPLLDWIEDALEKQFSSNSPEMLLVSGLLFALARLLECDPERYERDERTRKKVYSYLLTVFATTVSGNLSRYQVTKSSEIFLSQHANTFQKELGPCGHVWFSYMKFCCASENKTVKELAYKCSGATLKSINAYLINERGETGKRCLNKILKEVLPILGGGSADRGAVGFALQCVGNLAGSINAYLGTKSFEKVEKKLKMFGDSLLSMDPKTAASKWLLCLQFVQCIESFMREEIAKPLDDGFLRFLGDLLCHFMAVYPHCVWKSKVMVYKSILLLFDALSRRAVVEPLIDRFILNTLLISLSNTTEDEGVRVYHPETGERESKLLYDFEEFWLAFLRYANDVTTFARIEREKSNSGSDDVEMEGPIYGGGRMLQATLYDSVVKHVICILKQLNLAYTSENGSAYRPVVPRDHSIMLNLTEFMERVVGKLPPVLLLPWVPQLVQLLLSLASRMPLVSSFYRIGTVVATTVDSTNYFDDTSGDLNKSKLLETFNQFVTSVSAQARFYQDELLVACAAFVLASPIQCVDICSTSEVLKSILELGRSYLPAATISVTALERWQKRCPDKLEIVLADVAPLLSAYLDQEDIKTTTKKTSKRLSKVSGGVANLSTLQRRILLLLGKCSGKVSLQISESRVISNGAVELGNPSSPFFQLELQLSDISVSLPMSTILVHLGELAGQSTIRRVKASASESYHALICYLCGKTTTHPHVSGKKTVFFDIWRVIFARILRLTTDPDEICRSLFEPLLFQLLRWFESNSNTYPFEYASFLDELIRSLSDADSAAVRALSARCIAAALTQILARGKQVSFTRTDDIFGRIFSLCRHPSAVQRNGATVAISCILRSLDEEDGATLARYAMSCVKNLLCALRMCDVDIQRGLTVEDTSRDTISKAVMKIERGVCRFSHLFRQKGAQGGTQDDITLLETTTWLFKQTSKKESLFRRLSRRVFISFSALMSGTCSQWLIEYVSRNGCGSVGAVVAPLGSLVFTELSTEDTISWMRQLSASLENYSWLFVILGDKFELISRREGVNRHSGITKRKLTDKRVEATDQGGLDLQHTLSWAIASFLNQNDPWNNPRVSDLEISVRRQWMETYLLTLASLCSAVKSSMDKKLLSGIADIHDNVFQVKVINKILVVLENEPRAWSSSHDVFDKLKQFCKDIIALNQQWAKALEQSADKILGDLEACVAAVNTKNMFKLRFEGLKCLSEFGKTMIDAGVLSYHLVSKYADVFAEVASKSLQYGDGLPDSYSIAVIALEVASACGWSISEVFVDYNSRRLYGPIYNDVVQFIPKVAVWKRCAKQVISSALTNTHITDVLVDSLRQVAGFKVCSARSSEWDSFVETLAPYVKYFIEIVKTSGESQTLVTLQVLHLFLKLCVHASPSLVEGWPRDGPIKNVRDSIIELLKRRGNSCPVKTEILRMLSLMASDSDSNGTLLDALVEFVFAEFPIVSTDVSRGSKDYDVFHALFAELLDLIEHSQSVSYLRIIYPCLKEGDNHLFVAELRQMLSRFSRGLASGESGAKGAVNNTKRCSHLVEMLDVLLDSSLDITTRQNVLQFVFTPAIELQTEDVLQMFYLMESPSKKALVLSVLATLISTSAEAATTADRFAASIAYSLIEILFRLMDPEFVRGEINDTFLGHKRGKGREFTMLICKCASNVATTTYEHLDEVTRTACCAAYCCLVTAVSRTQKQEKFFDQILFQPTVWTNIVDASRQYEFRAETRQFVSLPLSNLSTPSIESRLDKDAAEPRTTRKESTALRFFTTSSLSMDADVMNSSTATLANGIDQTAASDEQYVIELDEFNEHPCMVPLLCVLIQMQSDFGSNWSDTDMPSWMKKMFDVLVNSSTALNARVFLAKVAMNIPGLFTTYASSWAPAVMEALLNATDSSKEPEFHYLLRDCCKIVLDEWKNVEAHYLMVTATRFLNRLIELCPYHKNQVRDDNVLLVTQLITLWRDNVTVAVTNLSSYICCDDENGNLQAAKQFTALQVISAMLMEGLESSLQSQDHQRLIENGVLQLMRSKRLSLYLIAAEVGGLYLKSGDKEEFKRKLCDLIVSSYNDEDYGRFLTLLRNASMHQPRIIDVMMLHRISFVLPKVASVDSWSVLAADVIYNAAANEDIVGEMFLHIQSVLGRYIAHRHTGVQSRILQAISHLVDHIALSDLERLITDVSDGGLGLFEYFQSHELPASRELLFGITKKLYERHNVSSTIKKRIIRSLIQELYDPNEQLRDAALEYWNTVDIVGDSCRERLHVLFDKLHFPECADKWVLYSPRLLLGMLKKTVQYEQPLFPSDLGSGEFQDAIVDVKWESRTQSMTPMFSVEADTFRFRQKLPQTIVPSSTTLDPNTMVQSQLLPSMSASRTSMSITPNTLQTVEEPESIRQGLHGRRFTIKRPDTNARGAEHDKKSTKRFFQNQYAIQRKQDEAKERTERQGKVIIKRKYRIGDFPDIQIAQRDIVEPLVAVCATHMHTSRLVFEDLFSSIVTSPGFDCAGLAEKLERSLDLSRTSPEFVSCVESAYLSCLIKDSKLCEAMAISPQVLGEAGLASGQYYLSELVLNEQVIYIAEHKAYSSQTDLAVYWDLLYKLLGTVQKQNFLIALSMVSSTTNESKLALQAQLSGDLPLAIASYKKAASLLESQIENLAGKETFYLEADATRCAWQRLGCLETLNNWGNLHHELVETVGYGSDLWGQASPYLEQGIGHYLRSCIGAVTTNQTGDSISLTSLKNFIKTAEKDVERCQLLQSRFSVEVCLAYLASGDFDQARVSVETFYSNFLQQWRQTSSMATSSRLLLMQSLNSMAEIDELLDLVNNDERNIARDSNQAHSAFKSFVDKWGKLSPSNGEGSMSVWSQYYMVQDIIDKCLLNREAFSDVRRLQGLEAKCNVMLSYADAAISCDILALGSKMLKAYRELCNSNSLPKVSVRMVEVFISHVLRLVERQNQQSNSKDRNSSSIKLVTRYYETATKMFDSGEVMDMMETAKMSDHAAMSSLEAKAFASAAGFYAVNDLDDGLKDEYFSRALDVFQRACSSAESSGDAGSSQTLRKCRLTFVEFLVDLLTNADMTKLTQIVDRKTLTKLLVDNVLGGMARGDRESAKYFPQVCDMISGYPDIVNSFEQQVLTDVPLWTCLSWSAQLMALLNGPIAKTIVAILEKMAENYPVALFYDFKVTCSSSMDTFKVDLHRLQVLVSNPVMEKFVAALRLIHHPEIRLKEGLREIGKLLEGGRTDDARRKLKLVWEDCFAPSRPLLGGQIGRYNREWGRQAKKDMERILGKEGTKMSLKTVSAAREWIMNHFSVTPGKFGITKDMKAHLADFAEWLEEFDQSTCVLELPGQYTSYWGQPDPSTHTRILSFDTMLGVLASKQLPKRLTVHCSDEKDYTFLVKGGEDLRLDQRIEQLFGVMNQILDNDSRCRDLSIRTYNVIPMTQEIGLLEWVPNTSTLKGVIESQLQIDERCIELKSNKRQKLELFNTTAAKAYETFLLKQRGSSFSAKVIAPRSKDVIEQFEKVQGMIPGDLLRKQLLQMGSNFEAFSAIRDRFLKSLAAFTACSYVLGIGDRHLDNFLVDLRSARVIGIDFGVSFGSGASALPVPELIPFRYTRQMDYVFQPYDGCNLMAQEMQSVFEALRLKRQVIESVMNVFLHEPLLDWQQSTTTHQKGLFDEAEGDDRSTLQDSDVEMESQEETQHKRTTRKKQTATASPDEVAVTAWLPDVKIQIARRKLEGVSPGVLLKEELAQNPHLKQHLAKFHALVDTVCSSNSNTQEIAKLSCYTQAAELLSMATAPDLLGRTFQGWMPWL